MRTKEKPSEQEAILLPTSYAQQRIWFLDRIERSGAAYNVPLARRLRGPLDVGALKRALAALVERHESLRTLFTVVDGVPHQLIAPAGPVPLPMIDLRGSPDTERRALELACEQARRRFDLEADPPIRCLLIKLGDEDHVLALTLHHVVTDGWSMTVLNRDLGLLYRALIEDREADLPELPVQYADYASWQREWIESGGLDQQLEYWKRELEGAPALLELPTDRPRPVRQSFRGATVDKILPAELLESLKALSQRQGKTLFMTLLGAFAVLLHRYSRQDDIVVASPVANRDRIELEGLIGCFVNTLALRMRLHDDPSFLELLDRVQETTLSALSNQDLPFEKLVEEINPERSLSYPPVAQVMFMFQSVLDRPVAMIGLEQERIEIDRGTAKFDLGLYVAEGPDGLRISIEYATDLFDETTARRMLGHYSNLLRAAVADPDSPVSQLPLVSAGEREGLLHAFACGEARFEVACLHERFEAWAADTPDAPAVLQDGRALSYRELNERANQLAHHLRAAGVSRETLVALCLERSLELVVAIVAVLKAGGAYVPLDPDHPPDRLAFALEDCQTPVLITEEHLLERLPEHRAQTICLDRDAALIGSKNTANPEPFASAENLAYVIYTSGSTGRPKGVLVEHRNVARLFSATEDWFHFSPADTWTLVHSYAFDFSVWELWGALLHGGKLVVVPARTTRVPEALAALLARYGVTILNVTPSLFLAAMDALIDRADDLALRFVVFGGEALQPKLLHPWFERFGDERPQLVNMYGITETTVHVTYRPLRASDAEQEGSPIGAPIPDLSLYLLDRNLAPVPAGVPGELYVAGAGVARGYLNRPQVTAERFLENPFAPGRMYRTGDRARSVPGRGLVYEGRLDDQVKVRGYRIEPGEIEAVLTTHPDVREAVVAIRGETGPQVQLVAYVVSRAGPLAAAELRQFAQRALPAYMIPAAFTTLDKLPLTANGKVDRDALPAPDQLAHAKAQYVPPTTSLERSLVSVWQELLGIKGIGIEDNFFALGGHSLLAIRLVQAVREQLGRLCTLSIVFRNPTVRSLAAELHTGGDTGGDSTMTSTVLELQAGGPGLPLFCIGGVHTYQELADGLAPDGPVYGLFLPYENQLSYLRKHRSNPAMPATIEELAAEYIRVVRQQQPAGPYLLLGWCTGGVIAYEMTQQLVAEGEEVAQLVMLDASMRETFRSGGGHRTLRQRAARVKFKTQVRLGVHANAIRSRLGLPTDYWSERMHLLEWRMAFYREAIRRYQPRPLDRSALLILTEEMATDSRAVDSTFGWGSYIAQLEILTIPAEHLGALQRPAVDAMAAILSPRIEAVRAAIQAARQK